MLSHLSLGVSDLGKSIVFYDAVLGALGYVRLWTSERGVGYGISGGGEKLNLFAVTNIQPPGPGFHLAFVADDAAAVNRFHAAALALGGADLGAPGLRPHYGAAYYAAFVGDPDGYKLEAVNQ